jgi:hypothetical protein
MKEQTHFILFFSPVVLSKKQLANLLSEKREKNLGFHKSNLPLKSVKES